MSARTPSGGLSAIVELLVRLRSAYYQSLEIVQDQEWRTSMSGASSLATQREARVQYLPVLVCHMSRHVHFVNEPRCVSSRHLSARTYPWCGWGYVRVVCPRGYPRGRLSRGCVPVSWTMVGLAGGRKRVRRLANPEVQSQTEMDAQTVRPEHILPPPPGESIKCPGCNYPRATVRNPLEVKD